MIPASEVKDNLHLAPKSFNMAERILFLLGAMVPRIAVRPEHRQDKKRRGLPADPYRRARKHGGNILFKGHRP